MSVITRDNLCFFDRINLGNGWAASVLTGCTIDPRARFCESDTPPSAEGWRAMLEPLIRDASSLPGYEELKVSKSGELFRVHLRADGGTIDVVCRRRRVMSPWERIQTLGRSSPEVRHAKHALSLLRAGIETPIPQALIRRHGSYGEHWLITKFIADTVDLDQVALILLARVEPNQLRHTKAAMIEAVTELFVQLERHNLHHRDMKASNILFRNWDGRIEDLRVCLVDLKGVRHGRMFGKRMRWKPLVRLAASLMGYQSITRGDFGRFLRAYLSRAGLPSDTWKAQYRLLAGQARDYRRRARRRKHNKLDGFEGDE